MKKLLASTLLSATMIFGALPSFAGEECKHDMKKEECKQVTKEACKTCDKKDECNHMASGNGFETTIFGLPLNEGPTDRTLRFLVGAGLAGTGIYGLTTKSLSPELSWGLVGFSAIPFATAASGYCPIYQVFGLKYTF
jgi:hypothetical protein